MKAYAHYVGTKKVKIKTKNKEKRHWTNGCPEQQDKKKKGQLSSFWVRPLYSLRYYDSSRPKDSLCLATFSSKLNGMIISQVSEKKGNQITVIVQTLVPCSNDIKWGMRFVLFFRISLRNLPRTAQDVIRHSYFFCVCKACPVSGQSSDFPLTTRNSWN